MDLTVRAAGLSGAIPAIASKSCAHRLLICAALGQTPVRLRAQGGSEDIDATCESLRALGARIDRTPDGFFVQPIDRAALPETPVLDCGESGSTLRFLLPVAAALGVQAVFRLHGRLPQRPLAPLDRELAAAGCTLDGLGTAEVRLRGALHRADFRLPGNVSSQYISGLLFALPLLGGGSVTVTGDLESKSYVNLTCDALRLCGITVTEADGVFRATGQYAPPAEAAVEGDWSNAAFWLCAGAIGRKSVRVTGLNPDSAQGDRAITALLSRFGARVETLPDGIRVRSAPLHGIDIDAAQIPDLVPVLAVVAAVSEGRTRIHGAARLRIKESDRLQTTEALLRALGAQAEQTPDGLVIEGRLRLHGAAVDACGDHRIAMSAAVAALVCDGAIIIRGAEAVRKSYPGFFSDFAALGGEVEEA